jgi:dipeptide/tripeptide permease
VTDRRFLSRKFALACAGLIAGIVFFALGKAWVLGLYMAGNVGDSAVTK